MIEAVNSVIASSQLVRNGTEQAASVRPNAVSNIAAQPTQAPPIILAPYISPFVYVDNQFNKAVLQIRDSETGEVRRQFPSEQTLRNRAETEAALDAAQAEPQPQQAVPSSQPQTLQSATLFAASQIGSETSAPQVSAPQASAAPAANIAQAQIASAALSAASAGPSASATVSTSA